MKVGFISLGCSKNLVDTEMTIGLFQKNGFAIVSNPSMADIIVINTCGFIETAKEEAINTILEMAEYKKNRCKFLIVMGCLVQRYKPELEKAIPEVDLFLTIDEYPNMWDKIKDLLKEDKILQQSSYCQLDYENRVLSTGNSMAYLKIAEGCSNKCTYCAIPSIRGEFVSRKKEDIVQEAKQLANRGIKELIVIAQDTTKYGVDLYGKPMLADLLQELEKIEGFTWIRFLYAYPETITEELIDVVKNSKKICHYFDIPIQHISNKVLKRMNRKSDGNSIRNLITDIRRNIPDVILRTTVIVGFPGETEQDFQELYEFIEKAKFDKLGAFCYSKEEGTPAYKLKEQIHGNTKKARYKKIMELQNKISKKQLEEKIGNTYLALIESVQRDGKQTIGRTYMDVPDMDGVIFIKGDVKPDWIGKFKNVRITAVKEYDLIGEII